MTNSKTFVAVRYFFMCSSCSWRDICDIGGYNWGEGYHQHPDELFLTGVLDSLRRKGAMIHPFPWMSCLPENRRWMGISEYFNSETSTLNPYNRGYAFFVYGNLPMTATRVLMEATGTTISAHPNFCAADVCAGGFVRHLLALSTRLAPVRAQSGCACLGVLRADGDADSAIALFYR
jgi:hypothetical protein